MLGLCGASHCLQRRECSHDLCPRPPSWWRFCYPFAGRSAHNTWPIAFCGMICFCIVSSKHSDHWTLLTSACALHARISVYRHRCACILYKSGYLSACMWHAVAVKTIPKVGWSKIRVCFDELSNGRCECPASSLTRSSKHPSALRVRASNMQK